MVPVVWGVGQRGHEGSADRRRRPLFDRRQARSVRSLFAGAPPRLSASEALGSIPTRTRQRQRQRQ
eukprot:56540-Rhodomonas_salina.1